jgi:hypothetical protein
MGCKRILISNKYFPTFNRKNVELVTEGVQEITANGIVTKDGKERQIDCLIYGTGFITDPRIYLKHFDCFGRNGIELKQAWKDGAESYYGIATKNFPNLFQLLGPNTILGHNSVIFMIESQVNYILQLIQTVDILFCNEPEAQALYQTENIKDITANFSRLGNITVVTRGSKGALVINGDFVGEVEGERVSKVLDTTGAGDLFAAGFLHAYTQGKPLTECAALGNKAAAHIIQQLGARPLKPLRETIAA